MPSIGTQTSPPSKTSGAPHGLPTPPRSRSSTASSRGSMHSKKTPYCSAEDVFMQSIKASQPRVRVRMGKRERTPPIHIHFENIHLAAPSAPQEARPATADEATQAGEPQLPQANPNSWLNKIKRWLKPLRPLAGWIMAIGMFFLERVGFGIRLN